MSDESPSACRGGRRPREGSYVPPIDPAQIPAPSREIYGRMGEENIVRMRSSTPS
jgi:hypothetical protein